MNMHDQIEYGRFAQSLLDDKRFKAICRRAKLTAIDMANQATDDFMLRKYVGVASAIDLIEAECLQIIDEAHQIAKQAGVELDYGGKE